MEANAIVDVAVQVGKAKAKAKAKASAEVNIVGESVVLCRRWWYAINGNKNMGAFEKDVRQ